MQPVSGADVAIALQYLPLSHSPSPTGDSCWAQTQTSPPTSHPARPPAARAFRLFAPSFICSHAQVAAAPTRDLGVGFLPIPPSPCTRIARPLCAHSFCPCRTVIEPDKSRRRKHRPLLEFLLGIFGGRFDGRHRRCRAFERGFVFASENSDASLIFISQSFLRNPFVRNSELLAAKIPLSCPVLVRILRLTVFCQKTFPKPYTYSRTVVTPL
ncbi:hypothetical protein FB451DRAFT_1246582 [Mycena latifolia]|nr:hypothetical protein FB451DRAFT_1246582 [Mycena latifolia]